jgi:hypothetical protein
MVSGMTPEGAPLLTDLRLVDHDVILVREGGIASNPLAGNFTYNVAMDVGGANLEFTRGYTATDTTLYERIDHIFLNPQGKQIKKIKAKVVGDDAVDMTINSLWPSDHAGVVSKIKFLAD